MNYSVVKSYGLACVHNNKLCLVRRRSSYKFMELMRTGKMSPNIFNQMTLEEKMALATKNFDTCERLLCHSVNPETNEYIKRKTKFEKFIISDGGNKLINFINKSTYHPALIWELPKGRPHNRSGESTYECAIREFIEETNIKRSAIKVFPDKKFTYSFIDDNICYEYIYYLAFYLYDNPIKGIQFMKKNQMCEAVDMQWFTAEEITLLSNPHLNCNYQLGKFAKSIINISKSIKKAEIHI